MFLIVNCWPALQFCPWIVTQTSQLGNSGIISYSYFVFWRAARVLLNFKSCKKLCARAARGSRVKPKRFGSDQSCQTLNDKTARLALYCDDFDKTLAETGLQHWKMSSKIRNMGHCDLFRRSQKQLWSLAGDEKINEYLQLHLSRRCSKALQTGRRLFIDTRGLLLNG